MGKARNLSTLLDAGGDVKVANLDNVPASNNASALTTGTIPDARFPSTLPAISGVNLTNITDQNFTNADHSKLDAIEASATADQTAAQIKAAYEGNSNTNVHTDAQVTKLSGIETSATADQTAAQIKTKYETNSNTNAFNDAAVTKLANIETSATADQTGAQIKTLYQAETNAFTDTKNTKLSGIETSATADQTNAEIKAAVQAGSDIALAGNPTTTTQNAANNSTRIATTAYTDAAIAALSDSAPGTLNTLNELAAALGDDANYATTTTNAIAAKLPKAGGTMTGALTLSGNPSSANHAANKAYVDALDALPSQSGNSGKFLTTDATNASWAVLDTDANTTTKGLYEMANTISSNYSITSGNNALTAGPITINTGVTVTIPTGSTWVIA